MAGLVDQYGRPIDMSLLKREISGPSVIGTRSIVTGHPADGLTPLRLVGLLRSCEGGGDPTAYLELAEQMEEKDLHYLSVLGTRKRAVTQLEITVEADDTDAEAVKMADLVREWLDRDELDSELFDVMDGVGKGRSYTELVWEQYGNLALPQRLEWRDPRWFRPDLVDGCTPKLLNDQGLPEDLPPRKFLIHTPKAKSGLPLRGGIARAAAWAYLFKNYALKDWVQFAEVFGLPLRVGRYANGETPENIRLLANALAQLGVDASAVFPESMKVEFIDGKGTGNAGTGELYENLCNYLDQQVSKGVLGQTATTDSVTGGLGSGKEHGDVRNDIRDADARQLAASINRDIVRPIIDVNFGPQTKYPRVRLGVAEQVDIDKVTKALGILVPLGLKVSMAEVRDLVGFDDPDEDEELLGAPVSAADPNADPAGIDPANQNTPPGSKKTPPVREGEGGGAVTPPGDPKKAAMALLSALNRASGSKAAPPPAGQDAVDLAVAAVDDWEPMLVDQVVERVDALLASCSTLQEASDRLAGVMADLDPDDLTELLARGSFSARLAGLAGVDLNGEQ